MARDIQVLEFLNDYNNWYLSNDYFRIKPPQKSWTACDSVIYRVIGASQETFAVYIEAFQNILISMDLSDTYFFFLWEFDGEKFMFYYGLAADLSMKQTKEKYEQNLTTNSQILETGYRGYFPDSGLELLTEEEKNKLMDGFDSYEKSGFWEGTPGVVQEASYAALLNRVPKFVRQPYRILVVLKSLPYSCISGLTSYVNQVIDDVSTLQSYTKNRQRSNRKTSTINNTLNCLASNSHTATDTNQRQRIVVDDLTGASPPVQRQADDQLLSEDIFQNPDDYGFISQPRISPRGRMVQEKNRIDRLDSVSQQSVSSCEIIGGPNNQEYGRINMINRDNAAASAHQQPLAINNAETGIGSKTNSAINNPNSHATTDPHNTHFLDTRLPLRVAVNSSQQGQADAKSATRSDASSDAKVALKSINDSISKANTNEDINAVSRSEVFTNSLARDWVNYLNTVVKPQLVNAVGYGLYVTGVVFYAKNDPVLRQVSSMLRSQWLASSQFAALKLTPLEQRDERRCAFSQFQIPQYMLDEEEYFEQIQRVERAAFTQLLMRCNAYCCNYQSGKNVSFLLKPPASTT